MDRWIDLAMMVSVELLIHPLFLHFNRKKFSILIKIPKLMTELKKLHSLPNQQLQQLQKLILPIMPTKLQFQKQLLFLPLQQLLLLSQSVLKLTILVLYLSSLRHGLNISCLKISTTLRP